jgi:tetratricopeptide (TPR) repeat protein
MRWLAALLLCVSLGVPVHDCLAQALDTPVLGKADALLREGRAEEAWQLLSPLEREYAGRLDFDYLLGVAALESGRPNRATFVLERVLAVNPGHIAARLEMARAYFALGDFERAEREFDFILRSAPPEDIRGLSQTYLAAMRTRAKPERTRFTGYGELTVGRDTNVAAAAAQGSFFVPLLGTEFIPDPALRRRADNFVALGGGLEYAHPIRADLGAVAGADVAQRWHSQAEAFDARMVQIHGALVHRPDERDELQYSAQHNHYELDNARYREAQALGFQWSRALSRRTRVAGSVLGYRLRYIADEAAASSSNLYLAGASVTHVLEESSLTTAAGAIHAGHDDAVAGRADGDRRMVALSLALQRVLARRVEGYARLSVLRSDYVTQNPDFAVTRRDRQVDATIGFGWEFAAGWFLRTQVSRTSNGSNVPLNEYRRTETSLALRRVWD